MATVETYTSGEICNQVRRAFSVMDRAQGSLEGTEAGQMMLERVNRMAPRKLSLAQAIELIETARQWAVGPRVCLAVHTDAKPSEAVFLDDLAVGMAEAGKARMVDKEEALATMETYRKHPIIVSRVSGQYSEICPSWAKRCVYWNMEKHKLKCIAR